MITQLYYYLFGILSIFGGALGFARAKSKASLIAGGISGAFLIIAGLLYPNLFGSLIALVVSVLLLVHFGRSYAAKKKAMPAIPMMVLSGLCILLTAITWHAS
jgi:uncharacterized membrane protein (UPF0136 family)